jgi:cob(I)alamin adenosyltransferase
VAARRRLQWGRIVPEEKYDQPRIRLDRIYTRTGDEGQTGLASGRRVSKDHPRLECCGAVDELNATIGVARLEAAGSPELDAALLRVQHELFNLGSLLATPLAALGARQARPDEAAIERLESEIDRATAALPALTSFVLPGGSRLAAALHVCRTVCRRAERRVVTLDRAEPVDPLALAYLNRLSDALFVWSRLANLAAASAEVLWQPNQPR